jgi:hypothetical protein
VLTPFSNTSHHVPGSSPTIGSHTGQNPPRRQPTISAPLINGYQHTNDNRDEYSAASVNGNAVPFDATNQVTQHPRQNAGSQAMYFPRDPSLSPPTSYASEVTLDEDQNVEHPPQNPNQRPISGPQQSLASNETTQEMRVQHSLPTQTWSATYSLSERLRLGLPRYASEEERRRADDRAAAQYRSAFST